MTRYQAPKPSPKRSADSSSVEKAAENLLRTQQESPDDGAAGDGPPKSRARRGSIEKSMDAPPPAFDGPETFVAPPGPPEPPEDEAPSPQPPPAAAPERPEPPRGDGPAEGVPDDRPADALPPSAERPAEPAPGTPAATSVSPSAPQPQPQPEPVHESLADRYRDAAAMPAPGVSSHADALPADEEDTAGDEEAGPPARRRRGVFGILWAVTRFLLIGRKQPSKKAQGKQPARKSPKSQQGRRAPAAGAPAKSGLLSRIRLPRIPLPRIPLPRNVPLQGVAGLARRVVPARLASRLIADRIRRRKAAAAPPTQQEMRRQSAATGMHRPIDLSRRMSRTVEIDLAAVRAAGMVTPFGEHSQIAEEFRLIKRPLLLNAFEAGANAIRHGNVIMISSSRAGEGKTFTAINLAMSIASERDLTVLLIDADVAKPDVANVLGFTADVGLVDLIADDRLDVSDVILRTNIDNLSVIPAGQSHHLATELLASDRMAKLVSELSHRYPERVIVMDSPPALQSSVAGVLALNVGQILFVVEAEHTSQTAVDNAIGLVSACKNINLLLNKSRPVGGSERFGAGYGGYY